MTVLLIFFLFYYITILWGKIDDLKNKIGKYEKSEKPLTLDYDTSKKESYRGRKKADKKESLKNTLPEPKFEDI